MYKITRNFTLRITVFFTICSSLLVAPGVSLLTEASQGQGAKRTAARPGLKKPEGDWPDLSNTKSESNLEREAPPPIPSTMRSPKLSEKPWNGRRVGDPETTSQHLDQAVVNDKKIRRAHARKRLSPASPPMSIYEDTFIQNFFNMALLRGTNYDETLFWNYQLRVAYNQGQTSLKLAAIELGKTVLESASYAARNRDSHWYVYDLYKTYLMRDPDSSGWAYWESQVVPNGRENVRRGFEESGEFATLLSTIVLSGSAGSNPASLITARVDPRNQPGNGMLARDTNWTVSLLSLPGRNGLDLGLTLSYSSMVWTPSGPYFHFDEDNGFPSPGFRLGFPIVQRKVFDAQTARNSFLLITPDGRRVELRQVGTSNIYEAADSSYLQLTDNSPNLLVRSPDGTQLSFVEINNEFSCTQVKDRNGNYITVYNNALGRITSITDTLGRAINFNYDGNANLISITQAWNGQPSHQWVSFGWSTRNMQYSFAPDKVIGTSTGAAIPVITQVAVNDTSYFTFDYTSALQVSVIRNYFGATERNATSFTYEIPSNDVPRLMSSSVSAQNWTGVNGVPAQVTTQFSVAGDGACVMTAPDGTLYKEYYGTGWQKGLTILSEIWSGGVKQKWTTTAWSQDNTSVSYETNPRVTETNIYDSSGNRRRTVIDWGGNPQYVQYGLPYGIREYAADGVTEIRQTWTDYDLSPAYLDRRIIGLVTQVHLTNVSSWQGKISYGYDDPARLSALPAAATQHDSAYNTSLTARGNVTSVTEWDFTDIANPAKALTSYTNYDVTGNTASETDPLNHTSSISYADAFSDSVNRNTFAYPTTMTDAGGYSSTLQYNFDFGATTRTQTPAPANQSQGAIQTMTYNSLGQLERVTISNTNAYKRFWYGPNYVASYATVNNVADESYAIEVVDGLGRVIGATKNHPGSSGGYSLVSTIYDHMGRAIKVSNPTEINNSWLVSGDDAGGIYYTEQTYDWKGRPLVTTNTDSTTKIASYSGCGCAGGEVVTLTDEGTIDAGTAKRRQMRIYADVFGRIVKTEKLNWQGGTVYSATVNTYNVRDQLTQVRQYAGAEGSGTYQDTTMTYDGYGRLKTRHVPEQNVGLNTVWTYNADDTISSVTDARGAATTYGYNNRQMVTSISYSAPAGIPIPATVSYGYDAARNRTSMSDGSGSTSYSYNQLSRMTSETRSITGAPVGSYTMSYSYNLAGALTSLTDPQGRLINYAFDVAGRLNNVSGSGYNVSTFMSNYQYRAWGAPKHFESPAVVTSNPSNINFSYNSRMQLTHFEFDTPSYYIDTYRSDYQYYADGRVRFISDARAWTTGGEEGFHNFDRAYQYDHSARLTIATTGAEARGGTTVDGPYKETYQYDAWNHLTQRMNRIWSRPLDWYDTSYINNRNQHYYYSYDVDGNPTSEGSFDAAGRKTTYPSSRFYASGWNPDPIWQQSTVTNTYDGDGRLTHQFEAVGADHWDTYFARSTVLRGEVILWTEVATNPIIAPGWSNTIRYASVYANGDRIAQVYSGLTYEGNVTFELPEPLTGRRRGIEPDPLGQEVGTYDPGEGSGDVGSYPETREFGNVEDMNLGCTLDGITVDCATASRVMNSGAAAQQYLIHDRQGWHSEQYPIVPIGLGLFVMEKPYFKNVNDNEGPGTVRDTEEVFFKPDQAVIDLVKKVLSKPECAAFMKAMLNAAATEENAALEGGDIGKIFDDFLDQNKGGLAREKQKGSPYGTVRGRIGTNGDGNGVIYSYATSGDQVRADASNIIQELPHLAGTKLGYPKRTDFGDFALAHAIRETKYHIRSRIRGSYDDDSRITAKFPKLKGVKQNPFRQYRDKKSQKKNEGSMAWSSYVHDLIVQMCPLP